MHISSMVLAALLFGSALSVLGQDMIFAGTKPPDPGVLELLGKYEQASTGFKTVAERDARRKPLLSPGYFYHGMDGKPIDADGLTARQTKNDFKQTEIKRYDFVLYQYENTAILAYHAWAKGSDKGKAGEGYSSLLLVMGKENGVWKVLSDIIGQAPAAPEPPRQAAVPTADAFETVKEFLLTSSARDFYEHQPPFPAQFRNVRIGHAGKNEKDISYRLCGEFLPADEGSKAEWTGFVTIKTSGYEQYIGSGSTYCSDAKMIWDTTGDLSSTLKSRLDSLKKKKE